MKCEYYQEKKRNHMSIADKKKLRWIFDQVLKEKMKELAKKKTETNVEEIDPVMEVTDNGTNS